MCIVKLSVDHSVCRQIVGRLLNSELESTRKEAAVASCQVLTDNLSGGRGTGEYYILLLERAPATGWIIACRIRTSMLKTA